MKLEVKNITRIFTGSDGKSTTKALDNVSFSVDDGEFISIIGPSGCGKSTLLRLIAGILEPTEGELLLGEKPIEGPDKNRGMVFQKPTLFPWLTVEDNVMFSQNIQGKRGREEAERLIEMVGLSDFKKSYPSQLSGGMAQRVSLIRTVINRPEVFLLDEPLGQLDAFSRINMQEELLRLWNENHHIMIMVTHDVDEAIYMSNRVIIMEPRPGRIKRIMDIDLPYPRNRLSDEFSNLRNEAMKSLGIE